MIATKEHQKIKIKRVNLPRHNGIFGDAPFILDLMKISMANSTIHNFELHIFFTSYPAPISKSKLNLNNNNVVSIIKQ